MTFNGIYFFFADPPKFVEAMAIQQSRDDKHDIQYIPVYPMFKN